MKQISILSSILFCLLSPVFCLSKEIEVPEVLIEGEDRSRIEREREEEPIKFEPRFEEEKRKTPIEVPVDERKISPYEEKKEEIEVKDPPPEFDFKISYGSYDSLSYEFQGKQERRQFGYLVGILRGASAGFKEMDEVFNDFSLDDLHAKTNLYFDKWDLSVKSGYYKKGLILPYNDNKEKGMCIDLYLRSKIKTGETSNLYLSLYGATGEKNDLKNKPLNPEVKYNTIWKGYDLTFGIEAFKDRLSDYLKVWASGNHIKLEPLLLNLRLGLEKEFIDGFVSFSYGIEDMTFNLLVEKEISFPEFNRLYLKRDYVRLREDISKTKAWIYKVRLDYNPYPYLKFIGSVFYKDINDLIAWKERDRLFEIRQIDEVLFGIDTEFSYEIIKDLSAKINLSYVDKYIPLEPKLKACLSLNYLHKIADFRLITKYIGKRKDLPDYITVGIEVSRNVSPHITIFLQGESEEGKISPSYPGDPGKICIGMKVSF